ncbi:MAG: UbiX family flavin prenyltransferase [Candidatus Micrarchaeota archaeon]|nr:UbiX family flavin prenyltransferase [Candidatus Micrarchaeota archaeon]
MKIVLCITGASGVAYGFRLAQLLKEGGAGLSIVVTKCGRELMDAELGPKAAQELKKFGKIYDENDFSAPFASGSNPPDSVVICPCSLKTLSAIANGYSNNLVARAADVALKEKKKLIVVPRETPLSTIAIRNMLLLAEAGAVVMPACPGFYSRPRRVEDLVDFITARVLDHIGLSHNLSKRWGHV